MAQYPASTTGDWTIYSVQKNLLGIAGRFSNDLLHNYLVLVDPQGNAVLEMQGVPSTVFHFGATAGDYLEVRMTVPNQYLDDERVLGAPTLVLSGDESTIVPAFNNAFDTVAAALNSSSHEDLYAGDPQLFDDDTIPYNSNSVWFTAMQALKAAFPSEITNPISSYVGISSPGDTLNLVTAASNNPLVTPRCPVQRLRALTCPV
jgi:hypothetical protein